MTIRVINPVKIELTQSTTQITKKTKITNLRTVVKPVENLICSFL